MKKYISSIFVDIFVFCSVFVLFSCSKSVMPRQTRNALGTVCSINLYEDGTQELYETLFSRINQIENEMSSSIEDSEIYQFNIQNKKNAVKNFSLSDDTYQVLSKALEIAKLTGGAFDPSIGALVQLWNINGRISAFENPVTVASDRQTFAAELTVLPNDWQIEDAKNLVDYKALELDEKSKTVSCSKIGLQIELGGIAKGYAADQLVKILSENNVKRAIIDLGGNIYAFGAKKVSDEGIALPWKIGIKNPLATSPENNILLTVDCIDKTVVTSGSYERFFENDGQIYHHIIDAKTGKPADTNVVSVSIICENSMLADSLSTSFFILGYEKSTKLLAILEETYNQKIDVVFLYEDGTVESTLK